MKRLGIFFCYDKQGIIDDYIFHFLDDICQNLEELCVVSNGKLTDISQEKLKKYTNNLVFRPNRGFDAAAWRDVMVDNYGFEKLKEFDEVVLFNDSFFGPIYPFKIMFDKMEKENIDFWGITEQDESPKSNKLCPYKKPPRHIQTYFLAFRRNLFKSQEFQDYWKNLPDYKTRKELTYKHEIVFTKYFSDLGYGWKPYIQLSDDYLRQENMDFLSFDMYEMISNKDLPILKKDAFKIDRKSHLYYNFANDLSKTIDYVKENTDYDVSLIYKCLLRIRDPNEIVNALNLIKIFKKDRTCQYQTSKKVLAIIHVYYDDLWEYDLKYLKNIPDYIDILITTDTDDKKEFFEENVAKHLKNDTKVIKIYSRGRDMASLLVASRDIVKNYDYFCFMHDKKSHHGDVVTWANTFRDVLWENNLASESYVNRIIQEFDENSSLGLIVPPKIYHGDFFHGYVTNYWATNYGIILNLLEQMGISTPISKSNPTLSLGNCFWARYDAVEPIFDLYLDYTDFPQEPVPLNDTISHALERIYPYVAASREYLTEIVMTEDYAKSNMLNYNYMLLNTVQEIYSNNPGKDNSFSSFRRFYKSFNKLIKRKPKK